MAEQKWIVQLLEAGEVDTVKQARIVIDLISLQILKADAIEAAKNCSSVDAAIDYLNQECESCNKTYRMNQMIDMLNCTHRCCEVCAKSFFTMQITHHSVADCICPYCRLPDLKSYATSMYEKKEYLTNLSVVLERVLNPNIYKIFQTKLNAFLDANTQPSFRNVQKQSTSSHVDDLQHNLMGLVLDGKVRDFAQAKIVMSLMSMKFTEAKALDAARNCNTLDHAISYLNTACGICNNKFAIKQLISMLNCNHRFCRTCTREYFTRKITHSSVTDCTCPICTLPNFNNDDEINTYLSNLDIILKDLLDADMHERFQQKLRDFALRNDPSESAPLPNKLKIQARLYVTNGRVKNYMQSELVIRLIQAGQSEEDALEAVKHCSTIDGAIAFLNQECSICTDKYRMNQMVAMLNCEHRCCNNCAKTYFTTQINERPILDCNCPVCSLPNLNGADMSETEKNYYFSNLDILLKGIVQPRVHEVFQRKLRDWSLVKNPDFKWCPHCSSGYIADGVVGRVVCVDCRAITCVSCRKPWEDQHEGISCERFTEWKVANDPETQAANIANHLATNGIDCPKCKHRFSLARGGCMHFTCSQCKHEFCQGCAEPFSRSCSRMGCAIGRSLHAHHPKNCLYYLRDREPAHVQRLLKKYNVPYNTARPTTIPDMTNCSTVMELTNGKNLYCPNRMQDGYAGFCRQHYNEYLCMLILKSGNINSP